MTQKAAYYRAKIGKPGAYPDTTRFYAWQSRADMTRDLSRLLDIHGFSQRNRRQVNLAELWQDIQRGATGLNFTIRGNMGNRLNMEFEQLQAREYAAALEYGDAA